MGLFKILSDYDCFGGEFELTIDGHSRTKTLVGALLSFLSFSVVILSLYKFGSSYFDTTKPRVLIKDIDLDNHPKLTINKDPIYYFITISGPEGYLNPNEYSSYFDIKLVHENLVINTKGLFMSTTDESGVGPCKDQSFFKDIESKIIPSHLDTIKSFGICTLKDASLFEIYGGTRPPFAHLQLRFDKCSKGASCRSAEEVADLSITLYSLQHYFSDANKAQPFSQSSAPLGRFSLLPGEMLKYRFFVMQLRAKTEKGIILKIFEEDSGFAFEGPLVDKRKLYASDQTLALVYFYTSGRVIEYTRLYYKLLDFFSDVGGVIQVISFVVVILYSRYNSHVQRKNLIRYGIMGKKRKDKWNYKKVDSKASSSSSIRSQSGKNSSEKGGEKKLKHIDSSEDALRPSKTTINPNTLHADLIFKSFSTFVQSKPLFNPDIESKDNKEQQYKLLCEQQLDRLSDIYKFIDTINVISVVKDLLLRADHKILVHYSSLQMIHQEEKALKQKKGQLTYLQAIEELVDNTEELSLSPSSPLRKRRFNFGNNRSSNPSPLNSLTPQKADCFEEDQPEPKPKKTAIEKLLDEFFAERVDVFEKKFNGEVDNNFKNIVNKKR